MTQPTIVRHLVLAALLVITAINYIQRNSIGPAATTIEASIGVTPVQLDLAAGAFFLTYTLMQVPSGWLAKVWGPRLALALYAVGWSMALVACAGATGFFGLYFGRIAMGILQAGIFPCATLILAVWYPASLRGTATALLNSFMLMGGAAGQNASAYLIGPVGWRGLFLIYAVPGVLWAIWFYWWFRDRPEEHPGVNEAERELLGANEDKPPLPAVEPRPGEAVSSQADQSIQPASGVEGMKEGPGPALPSTQPVAPTPLGPLALEPVPFWTALLAALSLPLILLYTQQGFRAAANRLFDSRLQTYIEQRLGPKLPTDPSPEEKERHTKIVAEAATLTSWPQWAGVVGGLLGGILSDLVLRQTGSLWAARNGVALGSLVVCLGLYFAAWTVSSLYLAVGLLSAGAFFFCFSSPCAYALTIDMGGKALPVVFGLMNMIGNLGAYLFVSSIMFMVSLGGWDLAFGVWAGMHVVAIVCWLFLVPERRAA